MPHSLGTLVFIILLLALSVYRRVKRHIGWQILRPRRMVVRILLLLIISIPLMISGITLHRDAYLWVAAGIICGLLLAWLAFKTTQVRMQGGNASYRPNAWIGALLLVVFLARLAVRFIALYQAEQSGALTNPAYSQQYGAGLQMYSNDPWTLSVFLVLSFYYIVYYALLIKKSSQYKKLEEARPPL